MNENRFVAITHIAARPERVWDALTDTDFMRRYWFGCEVSVGRSVGEPFAIAGDGVQTDVGEVLAFDPPKTLSYTFQNLSMGEPPSRVTFTLEPNGEGTKLTLVHDEFPEGSEVLKSVRGGWSMILSGMKSLLEGVEADYSTAAADMGGGRPVLDPSPSVATVFRTYIAASAERIWSALTEPEFTEAYFFGNRIESNWRSGSAVEIFQADGSLNVSGIVLRSEPPHFLSYTWQVESKPEFRDLPTCWVEFEIEPLGAVCRLTMREFHAAPLEEWVLEGGRSGWSAILSGLKTLLETGRPMGKVEVQPPVRPSNS